MNKIKEFLESKGFVIYESDNRIEFNDGRIIGLVVKHAEDKYLVRNAVLCYFDRWANSGREFWVKSEDEVIKYFNTPTSYLPDAIAELIYSIVENSEWDGDYADTDKMIEFLHSLLEPDDYTDRDNSSGFNMGSISVNEMEPGADILCLVSSWEEPPYWVIVTKKLKGYKHPKECIVESFSGKPLINTKILKWKKLPDLSPSGEV